MIIFLVDGEPVQLSTDRAESSYGVPVALDMGGNVLDVPEGCAWQLPPNDAPSKTWADVRRYTQECRQKYEALVAYFESRGWDTRAPLADFRLAAAMCGLPGIRVPA